MIRFVYLSSRRVFRPYKNTNDYRPVFDLDVHFLDFMKVIGYGDFFFNKNNAYTLIIHAWM